MSIVLDTNVLVSALLRSSSPPGRILDLVVAQEVILAIDDRILAEYRDVLGRPEFDFPPERVLDLLAFVRQTAEHVVASSLPVKLPDPDDVKFIEVAVGARATAVVTGNLRHYPPTQRHGVRVVRPREWLEAWARISGP